MTHRIRIYHPETDEPFDVPQAKADDLRLNKGWRTHPVDPTAIARVQEVPVIEPDQVQDSETVSHTDVWPLRRSRSFLSD